MHAYLTKYQYKNASTSNLWEELEKASGLPIANVMGTWTRVKGFPMITVSTVSRSDNSVTLKLSQKKYSKVDMTNASIGNCQIPIVYETPSGVNQFLMNEPEMTVTLTDVKPTDWIKFNKDFNGFFYVHYDEDLMSNIMKKVASFSDLDKINIITDIEACCSSGLKSRRKKS